MVDPKFVATVAVKREVGILNLMTMRGIWMVKKEVFWSYLSLSWKRMTFLKIFAAAYRSVPASVVKVSLAALKFANLSLVVA